MTLKELGLGLLAFSLVAIPAAAQKGHSNKGGAASADSRSDKVQTAKATKGKQDKDHNPLPDNDKNKGKHKGETQGKHNAKGHSH